jgi:hypothetical protein
MGRGVSTAAVVFGIGILVVIAGFFLLNIEWIALHFIALGSLVFAFAAAMLMTLLVLAPKREERTVFYTAGLSGAIWVYVIAVIISVIFTDAFLGNLGGFIFLQIGLHALFFIIAFAIIIASSHLRDMDIKTSEEQQNGEYEKPKRGGY